MNIPQRNCTNCRNAAIRSEEYSEYTREDYE